MASRKQSPAPSPDTSALESPVADGEIVAAVDGVAVAVLDSDMAISGNVDVPAPATDSTAPAFDAVIDPPIDTPECSHHEVSPGDVGTDARLPVTGPADPADPGDACAFGVQARSEVSAMVAALVAVRQSTAAGGRSVSDAELANWFTHHAPSPEQIDTYQVLRLAGHHFAKVIRDLCPPGADTTTAIRKVREAVMTANAAIACS